VSRPESHARPLPAGWRFEPSDVVGAMADLYPEWACWQDRQNNVHINGFMCGLVLAPTGEARRWDVTERTTTPAMPGSGPMAAADVARWAVAVATGGDLPTR
jgi:hypothetical protein